MPRHFIVAWGCISFLTLRFFHSLGGYFIPCPMDFSFLALCIFHSLPCVFFIPPLHIFHSLPCEIFNFAPPYFSFPTLHIFHFLGEDFIPCRLDFSFLPSIFFIPYPLHFSFPWGEDFIPCLLDFSFLPSIFFIPCPLQFSFSLVGISFFTLRIFHSLGGVFHSLPCGFFIPPLHISHSSPPYFSFLAL